MAVVPPQKMQRCSDRDSDRERSEAALMRLWASRGPPPCPLPLPLLPLDRHRHLLLLSSSPIHRHSVPSTHVFFLFSLSFACASRGLRKISPPRATEQDGQSEWRGGEGRDPRASETRWKKDGTIVRTRSDEGDGCKSEGSERKRGRRAPELLAWTVSEVKIARAVN